MVGRLYVLDVSFDSPIGGNRDHKTLIHVKISLDILQYFANFKRRRCSGELKQ